METIDTLVAKLRAETANAQALFAKLIGEELLFAVSSAIDGVLAKYNGKQPVKKPAVKVRGPGKKKRARAVITPEIMAQVKALVKADKLSASQIGEQLGISQPSVQNIKKKLGLTKPHKK